MIEYVVIIAADHDATPIGDASNASDDVAAILPAKELCDEGRRDYPEPAPEQLSTLPLTRVASSRRAAIRKGRYPSGFE